MSAEYEAACEIREAIHELTSVLRSFAEGDAVLNVSVSSTDHACIFSNVGREGANAEGPQSRELVPGDLAECVDDSANGLTLGTWYAVEQTQRLTGLVETPVVRLFGSATWYEASFFRLRVRACRPSIVAREEPTF